MECDVRKLSVSHRISPTVRYGVRVWRVAFHVAEQIGVTQQRACAECHPNFEHLDDMRADRIDRDGGQAYRIPPPEFRLASRRHTTGFYQDPGPSRPLEE
jgi:hypothetical protein